MAWIALGAAASFLVYSERQLSTFLRDDRSFDLRARELTDALSDLRLAQQAYVAAGQGAEFWMPKVAQTLDLVDRSVSALRSSARSVRAHQELETAGEMLMQFHDADQRARDYLKADEQLMAADVIFMEGGETAAAAARQVESARLEEHQALDASTALARRQEAYALSGAGGLAALVLLVLGVSGARTVEAADAAPDISAALDPSLPLKMSEAPAIAQPLPTRAVLPGLHSAAELCTEFGRVRDSNDLQRLIGLAADAMNAAGLVVWLGSAAGADLVAGARPRIQQGHAGTAAERSPFGRQRRGGRVSNGRAADCPIDARGLDGRTGCTDCVGRRPDWRALSRASRRRRDVRERASPGHDCRSTTGRRSPVGV